MKVEELVPEDLWEDIRGIPPPPKPRGKRNPGRKPMDERRALTGILFVRGVHYVRVSKSSQSTFIGAL